MPERAGEGPADPSGALPLQLQAVLDSLPAMVGYWDRTLHNTLANQAYVDWFGLTPQQVTGRHIRDVIGEALFTANEPYMRLALQGQPQTFFREITDAHGRVRHTKASYLPDVRDGEVWGFVAQVVDVTDIHQARQVAEDASAFFEAVVSASPDFTFVVALETGEVVYGSQDRDVLGLTAADLTRLGAHVVSRLVHPDDQDELRAVTAAAADLAQGEVLQLTYRARHVDGSWRWLHRRITPFRRDAAGRVVEALGVVRDVTEVVEAEERLAHAALHDRLTGLPNRALLLDRLEAALERTTGEGGEPVSVLFVDLDGFKRVNDLAGHAVGDAVLVEAAHRLRSVLRAGETVARLGGDEFVVVLQPWQREPGDRRGLVADADAAVDVARRLADALRPPVVVDGQEHLLSASVGIAHAAVRTDGPAVSAQDLLHRADVAMYEAKARGKDRYEVSEPGTGTSPRERDRPRRAVPEQRCDTHRPSTGRPGPGRRPG